MANVCASMQVAQCCQTQPMPIQALRVKTLTNRHPNKTYHQMSNKSDNRAEQERAGANAKIDGSKIRKNACAQVEIPHGSDLQNPPPFMEQESAGLTADVFDNLPDLLKDACLILKEQAEKEVFLVGAIGVISGLLPNVRGFYDTQYYGCNLYVYILGAYGTGKGGLSLSRRLGMAVHNRRKELSTQLQAKYKQDCIEAKEQNQPEPEKPGNLMLFFPANNSKSGLLELLTDNDGRGILYETEGDTLADALKTEHGMYSDVLRKAFHQEPISMFRRTASEHREIENPYLSVVLSSTLDQYQKLITNIQNGLFSRFLHFILTPSRNFKDVFDDDKRGYPDYFDKLGLIFLDIYSYLEALQDPIEFEMTTKQKIQFLDVFGGCKEEVGEFVSTELDGMVNRLGLICFRLAMMFTVLRNFGTGDYSLTMICTDLDFENALRVVDVFKCHTIKVYYDLPQPKISKRAEFEKELIEKAAQVTQSGYLRKAGKSYSEIAEIVLKNAALKGTIWRWLNIR